MAAAGHEPIGSGVGHRAGVPDMDDDPVCRAVDGAVVDRELEGELCPAVGRGELGLRRVRQGEVHPRAVNLQPCIGQLVVVEVQRAASVERDHRPRVDMEVVASVGGGAVVGDGDDGASEVLTAVAVGHLDLEVQGAAADGGGELRDASVRSDDDHLRSCGLPPGARQRVFIDVGRCRGVEGDRAARRRLPGLPGVGDGGVVGRADGDDIRLGGLQAIVHDQLEAQLGAGAGRGEGGAGGGRVVEDDDGAADLGPAEGQAVAVRVGRAAAVEGHLHAAEDALAIRAGVGDGSAVVDSDLDGVGL